MFVYRLFWKDQELGFVEDVELDREQMDVPSNVHGRFSSIENLETIRPILDFLSTGDLDETVFANALHDERNWWLRDDWGIRRDITLPELCLDEEYRYGSIDWQWRSKQ